MFHQVPTMNAINVIIYFFTIVLGGSQDHRHSSNKGRVRAQESLQRGQDHEPAEPPLHCFVVSNYAGTSPIYAIITTEDKRKLHLYPSFHLNLTQYVALRFQYSV